jgi:hypothetical protein
MNDKLNLLKRFYLHFHDPAYWQALIRLISVIVILMKMAVCTPPMDFFQFYNADKLFFHHQNPYEQPLTGFPYFPWAFLITSFFSFFNTETACLLWSLFSLLLFMASIYLLAQIIFEKECSFILFPKIALAAMLAPCLWSFTYHNLTMVLLFFIALTVNLIKKHRDSFWIGATSSFLLLKPQLTLITLILFFFQAPNRRRFIAGVTAFFAIQFTPFIMGYRPIADLKVMYRNAQYWGTQTYFAEEQSLAAELMRYKTKPAASLSPNTAKLDIMPLFNTIKFAVYIGSILAALGLFGRRQQIAILPATSLTLLAGLLLSPYSHLYDGVMLVPLMLLTVHELSKGKDPRGICVLFLLVNAVLYYVLPLPGIGNLIHWGRVGACSIIYSLIFAGMWVYSRRLRHDPLIKPCRP